MKTISMILKSLKSHQAVHQQLELPLSGRELTRNERISVARLRRLRQRIALL